MAAPIQLEADAAPYHSWVSPKVAGVRALQFDYHEMGCAKAHRLVAAVEHAAGRPFVGAHLTEYRFFAPNEKRIFEAGLAALTRGWR